MLDMQQSKICHYNSNPTLPCAQGTLHMAKVLRNRESRRITQQIYHLAVSKEISQGSSHIDSITKKSQTAAVALHLYYMDFHPII